MCGRGGAAAVGNRHVGLTWDDEFAAGVQCSRAAGHHQILPDLSTKHTNKYTHTTTLHASSHINGEGVNGSSRVNIDVKPISSPVVCLQQQSASDDDTRPPNDS